MDGFSTASGRKTASISYQWKGISASCFVGWRKVMLFVLSKPASSKCELIPSWLAQQWTQALLRGRFRLPWVQHCPRTGTALSVYSWLTSCYFRAQASLHLQITSETIERYSPETQNTHENFSHFPLPPPPFFINLLPRNTAYSFTSSLCSSKTRRKHAGSSGRWP